MREETIYICETCGKKLDSFVDMYIHESTHRDNTPKKSRRWLEQEEEISKNWMAYNMMWGQLVCEVCDAMVQNNTKCKERYMRATLVYWIMFFIHMAACIVTWNTNIPSFPLTFITLLLTLICFVVMLVARHIWSLNLRKLFKPEHFNKDGEHETEET